MISVYVCFVVNRLTVTSYIAVRVFFYDYRHAALGNSCSKLGSFYIYGTKKKYGHSRTVVHLHLNERNVCSTTS